MKRMISAALICMGLLFMFYPWISDCLFQIQAGSQVQSYEKASMNVSEEQVKQKLVQARRYNECLFRKQIKIMDPFCTNVGNESDMLYEEIMNIDRYGMIGFLEIPYISVRLPIFHSTKESVLEKGVGHVEKSSFPVGGKNTHAVLTGHTGLSKARLFTDLRLLKKGNMFFIHVFEDTLAYRIVAIDTVLPEDTENLRIKENKDYVTLVTCTPYGINSHRLLVQGERTGYIKGMEKHEKNNHYIAESEWMKIYKKWIGYAVGFIVCIRILKKRKRKRRKRRLF